jgi:DNA-binding HxlR family transcriptional regulator
MPRRSLAPRSGSDGDQHRDHDLELHVDFDRTVRRGLDRALTLVGDRWSLLIVAALMERELRYSQLVEALSGGSRPTIAPNVLAARLRALETANLISAAPYQERPRRFEYSLTSDGRALAAVLGSLDSWGSREGYPTGEHVHVTCGTRLEWRSWCPNCQAPGDGEHHVWV